MARSGSRRPTMRWPLGRCGPRHELSAVADEMRDQQDPQGDGQVTVDVGNPVRGIRACQRADPGDRDGRGHNGQRRGEDLWAVSRLERPPRRSS